jgi:hypothetical protein
MRGANMQDCAAEQGTTYSAARSCFRFTDKKDTYVL